MERAVILASLGHFILDELVQVNEAGDPISNEQIVAGGGGLYAIVGCRLWLPAEKVALTVHRGSDFPEEVELALQKYGDCWSWVNEPTRLTFRARTTIQGEERHFEALTERFWDSPKTLAARHMSAPAYLHLVCSPKQALETVQELLNLGGRWASDTKIVYEPMPYECKAENWKDLQAVLPYIDTFSPNEAEASRFLGRKLADPATDGATYRSDVERMIDMFACYKPRSATIIRCGAAGACIGEFEQPYFWVPAYFTSQDQDKVMDVTGAGNAFLGGLVAGMSRGCGPVRASLYGSVSASYMLEQVGLPSLAFCNGEDPDSRLGKLQHRIGWDHVQLDA